MAHEGPQPEEREEGKQNPVIHDGAAPDPGRDDNETADDRVLIQEPDGSPSPRAPRLAPHAAPPIRARRRG